jgi:hypothetical protein
LNGNNLKGRNNLEDLVVDMAIILIGSGRNMEGGCELD